MASFAYGDEGVFKWNLHVEAKQIREKSLV